MNCKKLAVTALVAAFWASSSAQIVTYTTFDPGDVYTTSFYNVFGPGDASPQRVGNQFTAAVGGQLHSFRLGEIYVSANTGMNVTLYADNAGAMGAVLANWAYTNTNPSTAIHTLSAGGGAPTLVAGTSYWVEMWADGDGRHGWNLATASHSGMVSWSSDNGANYNYASITQSAFEVNVVPEPASFGALGLGLLFLRRRRKK